MITRKFLNPGGISWLLALCLFFSFASCSKPEDTGGQGQPEQPEQPEQVCISMSSRISAAEGFFSEWKGGEEVSVMAGDEITVFTVQKDGALESEKPLCSEAGSTIRVEAWYPASETRPASWKVDADQQNGRSADFLYAPSTSVTPEGKENRLEFYHQLALVTVKVQTSSEVTDVTVGSPDYFATEAVWKGNGKWSDFSGNAAVIPMRAGSTTTFSASVIPQKIAAKTQFIHASVDGQPMYYEIAEEMQLESGKNYTFTLVPKEVVPEPEPVIPTLNSDKASIIADGEDQVTFTVTPENAEIFCETEGGNLVGNVFTTTVAKEYVFKARLDGETSTPLTITATEPVYPDPVLTAEPFELMTGEESVLQVFFKEVDRTADAEFQISGGKVTNGRFSSETAGSFTVKALVDGRQSNSVTINVTAPAPEPEPEPEGFDRLILSVDKWEALANWGGKDMVTFKAMLGANDVTNAVKFFIEGEEISISPAEPGKFGWGIKGKQKIWAIYGSTTSNVLTLNFVGSNPNPQNKPVQTDYPSLHASKMEMSADGTDFIQFLTDPADAGIVCIGHPEYVNKKFTTTEAGKYQFAAKNDNGQSPATLTVTVKPGQPLVLTVSEPVIENDGSETVFYVTKGGVNVQSEVTMTMNGQPFSGFRFSSLKTGEYTFQATLVATGQKSNVVKVTVKEAEKKAPVLTVNKKTIYADGSDAAVFSVVPVNSVITCQELPDFSGTRFTVKVPGVYHFIATNDGMTSERITVEAIAVPDVPMDGDVIVSSPDTNSGWGDQGSNDGFIEF